jgi:hypothetical protein
MSGPVRSLKDRASDVCFLAFLGARKTDGAESAQQPYGPAGDEEDAYRGAANQRHSAAVSGEPAAEPLHVGLGRLSAARSRLVPTGSSSVKTTPYRQHCVRRRVQGLGHLGGPCRAMCVEDARAHVACRIGASHALLPAEGSRNGSRPRRSSPYRAHPPIGRHCQPGGMAAVPISSSGLMTSRRFAPPEPWSLSARHHWSCSQERMVTSTPPTRT